MLMLLFIALGVLTAAAAITTAFAVLRAKDGYEDESGFHFGVPPRPQPVAQPQPEWLRQLYAVFKKRVVLEATPKSRSEPVRRTEILATAKAEATEEPIAVSIR